jgi:anti-sigma regulatory factor (Ser/Thr protein kinase)
VRDSYTPYAYGAYAGLILIWRQSGDAGTREHDHSMLFLLPYSGRVTMSSPQYPPPVFTTTYADGPRQLFTTGNAVQAAISPPSPRKGVGSTSAWPLQSYLELAAETVSPARARQHTREKLAEWGLAVATADADLVVSELITNAVSASVQFRETPPAIRFWLLSDGDRLIIVVWDASPWLPRCSEAALDAIGGRGLQIIAALSDDWGWFGRSEIAGKCVWAAFYITQETKSRMPLEGDLQWIV